VGATRTSRYVEGGLEDVARGLPAGPGLQPIEGTGCLSYASDSSGLREVVAMSKNGVWVVLAVVGVGSVFGMEAQAQWTRADVGWCDQEWDGGDAERYCMALEADFSDPGRLSVDGGVNGGVTVEGGSRDVVEVRAKVWANARTVERAEEIANMVQVRMDRGRLSADGPDTRRRESWGVSWEVMVPRSTDLEIETHNGGIDVTDVSGRIEFEALNGGVRLMGVGGDVVGRTTNGGLHIELAGDSWDGEGLDVQTTNGGVTLRVPPDYSAQLETGTVNGGIDIDFPITVQGRIGRRLSATLGEGGPVVRAVTTNGGVRILRATKAIR
jgi:putative adhesin